jgi:crossover junction endodeoxyribonuclease RusA
MSERRSTYLLSTTKTGYYFWVSGTPVPKQSFHYTVNGGGFTDPKVKAWQQLVTLEASLYYHGAPLAGDVHVQLTFALPDRRRKDLDNLSKAVLDALNGIMWVDDTQVTKLTITKSVNAAAPGVGIMVVSA